jgi:hypothetical protein
MGSRKLSGESREMLDVRAMRKPAAKKMLRAVMPRGLERMEAVIVSLPHGDRVGFQSARLGPS